MRKYAGYILAATVLALGILGARLQSDALLYAMLLLVSLSLVLVVFDKIPDEQYPILIFCICLGMVYQLTLLSDYLVGTDIHYEYYFARLTYDSGSWDHSVGYSYNSALSITVFVPMMARLLHIPLEWSFKIIPPLFLSGIPVVAYQIYKKEFDSKTAFLAVFFLISVPTMFLELSGLAKQAIGELFFIMCLGLVAYNVFNLKWARYVLIALLALLTMVSHYSMGGTLFVYLPGAVVLTLVGVLMFKMKSSAKIGYLAVAVVASIILGVAYYSWSAGGSALRDITGSASIEMNKLIASPTGPVQHPMGVDPSAPSSFSPYDASPTYQTHWIYPEPAVAVALGLDFMDVNLVAKIFRLFQYTTQILIVVGVASILWGYRKRNLGYLVFLLLSGVLLLMVVFYPGFSPIFNASRFYNLALLFMAPAIVVGGKAILRNYRALAIGVLIPYFAFTSGAVFELTGVSEVNTITIPYSHALSAIRLDTTAVFTDSDIRARDWVEKNEKFPVYGDLWGSTAVAEVRANLKAPYVHYLVFSDAEGKPREVPVGCYILLRERNTSRQELTYYTGVGLRKTKGYEEVGFDKVLENRTIVFRDGDAIVYGPKEQ